MEACCPCCHEVLIRLRIPSPPPQAAGHGTPAMIHYVPFPHRMRSQIICPGYLPMPNVTGLLAESHTVADLCCMTLLRTRVSQDCICTQSKIVKVEVHCLQSPHTWHVYICICTQSKIVKVEVHCLQSPHTWHMYICIPHSISICGSGQSLKQRICSRYNRPT